MLEEELVEELFDIVEFELEFEFEFECEEEEEIEEDSWFVVKFVSLILMWVI